MNEQAQWNTDDVFPSQLGNCVGCGSHLDKRSNHMYDATTLGFCNKICIKDLDKKLIKGDKLTPKESSETIEALTKDFYFIDGMGNKIRKESAHGQTANRENKASQEV